MLSAYKATTHTTFCTCAKTPTRTLLLKFPSFLSRGAPGTAISAVRGPAALPGHVPFPHACPYCPRFTDGAGWGGVAAPMALTKPHRVGVSAAPPGPLNPSPTLPGKEVGELLFSMEGQILRAEEHCCLREFDLD